MEEQKTKVNGWKKIPIFFRVWIVLFSLALLAIPTISFVTAYSNSIYKITYVGIDSESTFLYANFNIDAGSNVRINATDFAVMVNNTPYNAVGFGETEYSQYEITSNKTQTISVKFNKILIDSNYNLQFYYKGKLLEFGKKVKFEI